MSYEKEQSRLHNLMQELLSDEENSPFGDVYSSDEYHPESYNSSDSDSSLLSASFRKSKRMKMKKTRSSGQGELMIHSKLYTQNISRSKTIYQTFFTDIHRPSTSSISHSAENETISARKSCSTIHITETIEDVIAQFRLDESSSEPENTSPPIGDPIWGPVRGNNLKHFPLTEPNPGVKAEIYERFYDKTPYDFYKLMVTDDIISHIVLETNRYAEQCKTRNNLPKSRIKTWANTTSDEIERFFGIIMWMGLFQLPSIESYWRTSFLYSNKIKSLMSRNRFQLLLKMIHFNNNEDAIENRLHKINPLIQKLIVSFQAAIIPQDELCIDETIVPFRGRLSFRQYIKNKRHKFGIKLF